MNQLDQKANLAVAIPSEQIWKYHLKETHQVYCFEKPEIISEYAVRFLV